MSDVVVARGEKARLGAVDGNLRVERDAVIDAVANSRIVVSGNCEFKGDATVRAPLECGGALRMKDGRFVFEQDLIVGGLLKGDDVRAEVRGPLRAGVVDVDRELRLLGPAQAQSYRVGGVLDAAQTLAGESISVGGQLNARGTVKARSVDVGGEAGIETCDLESLNVGGQARLGGGSVTDSLKVGGQLDVARPLAFGAIRVGGVARLARGGKGAQIKVGGMFTSGGDLEFGALLVGGMCELEGDGSGEKLELGGTIDVRGSLTLSGRMVVGGRASVEKELSVMDVEVGGALYAERLRASGTVDISGSLATTAGTFAREVTMGRRSEVRGPIRADRVTLGPKCHAEAVFASTVTVGAKSRVGQIIADDVVLDKGCTVGDLRYVRTLKAAKGVEYGRPPVQVASRTAPVG